MISEIGKKLYTLTYYFFNGTMHFWDILHGTDFSYIDKSVASAERSPYYATPWASLLFLKHYIRKNLSDGAGHKVLDIGCGKGYMLYFFSRRHFDRVSGIEIDSRLAQAAENNLSKVVRNKKELPDVFRADACGFDGYEKYDTFYLYNPFDRGILEKVLQKIRDSAGSSGRTLYLFYCNPLYEEVLLKDGWTETAHFYYKTKVFRSRCG